MTKKKTVVRKRKHATLPKKVKITYTDYSFVPLTAKQAEKEEIQGDLHFKKKELRYDSSLERSELVSTILHEILHGIVDAYDLKMNINLEEKIVNTMANGLTTVIKDNWYILAWLLEELHGDELRDVMKPVKAMLRKKYKDEVVG